MKIKVKGTYFPDADDQNDAFEERGSITFVDIDKGNGWEPLTIEESLRVANHSPTGFNWGYNGSGPAQLALAVCMEFMPYKDARDRHIQFKNEKIARIPFEKSFEVEWDIVDIIGKEYEEKVVSTFAGDKYKLFYDRVERLMADRLVGDSEIMDALSDEFTR